MAWISKVRQGEHKVEGREGTECLVALMTQFGTAQQIYREGRDALCPKKRDTHLLNSVRKVHKLA